MGFNNKSAIVFQDGDTATGAQAITFEMDIAKNGEYEVICVNDLSESLNYNVETWTDFCSGGFSSSATTGIDPEWSAEAVIRSGRSIEALAKKRYEIAETTNIPMRITNALLGEILEANVSITSWETNYKSDEIIKASFSIKLFEGKPTVKPLVSGDTTRVANEKK